MVEILLWGTRRAWENLIIKTDTERTEAMRGGQILSEFTGHTTLLQDCSKVFYVIEFPCHLHPLFRAHLEYAFTGQVHSILCLLS